MDDISNNGKWLIGWDNDEIVDGGGPINYAAVVRWNLDTGENTIIMRHELTDQMTVNSQGDVAQRDTIRRADGSVVALPASSDEVLGRAVFELFDPGAEVTAAGSTYSGSDVTVPVVWRDC